MTKESNTMTIPMRIEHGNHVVMAHLYAVPRVGEYISCAFPSSGLPRLFLVVMRVAHHQVSEFEGKECIEPFAVTVVAEGDPAFEVQNLNAMKNALADDVER